jgi:hypothetical protein
MRLPEEKGNGVFMRVIIDTLLVLDDNDFSSLVGGTRVLLQILHKLKVQVLIHPKLVRSCVGGENVEKAQIILSRIENYLSIDIPQFEKTPSPLLKAIDDSRITASGVDIDYINCIYSQQADFLITKDQDIHNVAKRLGMPEKVLSVGQALEYFSSELENASASLPPNLTPTHKFEKSRAKTDTRSPRISFYKEAEFFTIGEEGKGQHLRHTKGLDFIHFLLNYPNKQFKPNYVYRRGVALIQNYGEITIDGLESEGAFFEPKIDQKARAAYSLKITELKSKVEAQAYEDAMEALHIKEEIKELEAHLREKGNRDYRSDTEKARVNVTKNIKSALVRISEKMPSLRRYLNESTIRTGDSCSYSPLPDEEPYWILHPTEPTS